MPQATLKTEPLDEHLLEVVQALHGAVKRGVSRLDDSKIADQAIADCKEILDVIMAGKVDDWLEVAAEE